MSDSYQAIYDAVRSRISGGNIAEAVADAARQCFDVSGSLQVAASEWAYAGQFAAAAAHEHARPSAVYRPALSLDGNQWCALYGANLQEGVAGFGDTPAKAMVDFDVQWLNAVAQLPSPPQAAPDRVGGVDV